MLSNPNVRPSNVPDAARRFATALLLTLASVALAAGCASTRAGQKRDVLEFEPMVIQPGGPEEMELAALNDEELFALGTSAFAAKDFEKAARCFARLADVYLASKHRTAALYNAGLAYLRLGNYGAALERFQPLADAEKGTGDALDAAFRVAECYYGLDTYAPAIQILTVLANREDLTAQDTLQAMVQRGICLIESGEMDAAERQLRDSLNYWGLHRESERLDEYYPAQAQFFLGEIYRQSFEHVELDPDQGEEKLGKDLEYKCEMLLSAQGHYLRAIRIGEARWATASGFRIGALYENLYDAMVNARVPAGLDAEQAELYREELRRKVRVLVTKAMSIYERTLAAAERIGVDNPFVHKTRESLERMKQILVADPKEVPAAATGAPAESKPATTPPAS